MGLKASGISFKAAVQSVTHPVQSPILTKHEPRLHNNEHSDEWYNSLSVDRIGLNKNFE